jgi:Peptide-N-glycosidase F, C terminal
MPYTLQAFDNLRISSHSDEPNFQKATAAVDLRDGPFASATLVVDLATTCYPFENWTAPPPGQSWPADCDAFDRNFEFALDDQLELMRAITPFGGPEHQEIDITDVANGLPGKHSLTVTIPTYSDAAGMVSGSNGGWNVSAQLVMTPGPPPRKVLAVLPLFYRSQGKSDLPPVAPFDVPPKTAAARLEYRATGHGGAMDTSGKCIGPAEEFCKRTHHLLLDGSELQPGLVPWRNDCYLNCTLAHYRNFDYCMENPCGDVNSVQASRANWCPGTLTPPIIWDPILSPGAHQLTYAIDGIADGGSWRLSAVVLLFAD